MQNKSLYQHLVFHMVSKVNLTESEKKYKTLQPMYYEN